MKTKADKNRRKRKQRYRIIFLFIFLGISTIFYFLVQELKSEEFSENNNIKIKKIPEMLLSKCEFGKDNYNLNIINPPEYEEEYEDNE